MNLPPASHKSPPDAEIAVLEALVAEGEMLVAKTGQGAPVFRSRLRFVDPGREFVLVELSADAFANAALLALPRVNLLVEWGEWRIELAADDPKPVSHDGVEAIRLGFPEEVSINRRRILPRASVPQRSMLRCAGYDGRGIYFEATITDIGQGGIGMLRELSTIPLEPGTHLHGYRIEGPGREPVIADLEVRHTAITTLADGRSALRVGCRFVNLTPEIIFLVAESFGKKL